jgi:5-methylcytosine-specific restriction endonuclease McrA
MRARIPKAIREQVWLRYIGKHFSSKCYIHWCQNDLNVFDFHVGHNIPDSKGGDLDISNLRPICSRCNLSMSNTYTIDQWNKTQPRTSSCFGGLWEKITMSYTK